MLAHMGAAPVPARYGVPVSTVCLPATGRHHVRATSGTENRTYDELCDAAGRHGGRPLR